MCLLKHNNKVYVFMLFCIYKCVCYNLVFRSSLLTFSVKSLIIIYIFYELSKQPVCKSVISNIQYFVNMLVEKLPSKSALIKNIIKYWLGFYYILYNIMYFKTPTSKLFPLTIYC